MRIVLAGFVLLLAASAACSAQAQMMTLVCEGTVNISASVSGGGSNGPVEGVLIFVDLGARQMDGLFSAKVIYADSRSITFQVDGLVSAEITHADKESITFQHKLESDPVFSFGHINRRTGEAFVTLEELQGDLRVFRYKLIC
jgi:hypothetical protein